MRDSARREAPNVTTRMSWCPEVGATLSDRYELERRLGDGPTGVVFAAADRKLGEPCALKVLHPALFDGAHNATNLLRLQRARAFVHPGVVTLRDVVMDGQRVFVVTDLLGGAPLDAWIERQGAPSSSDTNAILEQLVAALEWIHQIGVHGNLKPANVLVTAGPKVTMTDPWTLAGRGDVPRSELPAVDEAWLAPEQRRPGWEESRAADVHGLGLLLGLMTAGRRVSGGLPLIAQGIVAPIALDTVFERATAASAADRFASVRALFEAAEPAVLAASLPLVAPRRAGAASRDPDETTDDALADAGLDPGSVDALMRGVASPAVPPGPPPAVPPGPPPAAPPTMPPDAGPRGGQVPGAELAFAEPSDISFGFGAPEETIVDFGGRHGAADAAVASTNIPPLEAVEGERSGALEAPPEGPPPPGDAPGQVGAETASTVADQPADPVEQLGQGARQSGQSEEGADASAEATLVLGAGALMATAGEGGAVEQGTGGQETAPPDLVGDDLDLTTRLDEAGAAAVLAASGAEAADPTLMDVAATFEMPAATPPPELAFTGPGAGEGASPHGASRGGEEPPDGPAADARDADPLTGHEAEADVLEAEVFEVDELDAELLEADVLEAEVLEAEALDAEVFEVEPMDAAAQVGGGGASDVQPGAVGGDGAADRDPAGQGGPTDPDASDLVGAQDVIELGASALIPEGAADALAGGRDGGASVEEGGGEAGDAGEAEPLELGDDSIVEALEVDEDSAVEIVELGASALFEVGADEAEIELGASALVEALPEDAPPDAASAPPAPAVPHAGPRFKPGPGVGANRTGQISVAAIRAGEGLPGVGAGADALALGLEDGLPAPDSGLLGDRMDSVLSVAPLGSALDAYDSMDASPAARPRGTADRRLGATIPPGTASALGAATSGVSSTRPGAGAPRKTTTRSHELRKPVMLKRRRSPFVYVAVALMVLAAALLVFVLTRSEGPPSGERQALAVGGVDAGAGGLDAGAGGAPAAGPSQADARGRVPSSAMDAGPQAQTDAGLTGVAVGADAGASVAALDAGAGVRLDAGAAVRVDAGPGPAPDVAPAPVDAAVAAADVRGVGGDDVGAPEPDARAAVPDAGTAKSGPPDAGPAAVRDAGAAVTAQDAVDAGAPSAVTFVPKNPKRFRCPGGMAKVRSRRKVTLADGTKVKDWDIFCIDKYEYPGQGRPPRVNIGLSEAKSACKARGRKLCSRSEWRKGCGGKYPYGRTYDPTRCNTVGDDGMPRPLVTAGYKRSCRSGWGTYDMVGNAAEWTSDGRVNGGSAYKDGASATCFRSSRRMGGHPYVGFRCCADAIPK